MDSVGKLTFYCQIPISRKSTEALLLFWSFGLWLIKWERCVLWRAHFRSKSPPFFNLWSLSEAEQNAKEAPLKNPNEPFFHIEGSWLNRGLTYLICSEVRRGKKKFLKKQSCREEIDGTSRVCWSSLNWMLKIYVPFCTFIWKSRVSKNKC